MTQSSSKPLRVTFVCGGNVHTDNVNHGTTVGTLRREHGTRLGLQAGATVKVNGTFAGDNTAITTNARVEFFNPQAKTAPSREQRPARED